MRVIHVTPNFHPVTGGLETFIADLASRQRAAGVDAHVLCFDRPSRRETRQPPIGSFRDIPITRIPFIDLRFYKIAKLPLDLVRSFDLIHVHTLGGPLDYLVRHRRTHQRPIIASTHGGILHTQTLARLKKIYLNTIARQSLHACRQTIASGPDDFALLQTLSPQNAIRIPNGVDLADFLNLQRPLAKPHRLLFVGRLARNKRVELLLTTLAELLKLDPRFRLDIVGPDFEQLLPELTQLARKLHLDQAVQFHGPIPRTAMLDLITHAGLCVSASRYEGFGLAVAETIAGGCVPVLQRHDAFADLVGPLGQDHLVDFNQPLASAQTIHRIASHPQALDQASATGRQHIRQFDWNHIFPRWQHLYANVLASA